MFQSWRRLISVMILAVALSSGACGQKEESRWDKAHQESQQQQAQPAAQPTPPSPAPAETAPAAQPAAAPTAPVAGGNFNKFFPKAEGDFEVVPAQEKEGFAEYKLKKGGKEAAMLAISDTFNNPDAAAKFANAAKKIGGYPAVEMGSTQTAILVANRFQVKVLSRDGAFGPADREAWLQKFDLAGLSQLQ